MLAIDANEIHVWYVDLTLQRSGVLSDSARERASRFRFERDRVRFLAAHSALRRILSAYAGEALVFREGKYGKPFIAHPATDIRFSMSHSEDVAAFAVAIDAEVGIDLEVADRKLSDVHSLAKSCFSEAEQRMLGATPAEHQKEKFLRVWTRKEAYLKAIGLGLQVAPEEVGEVMPGWVTISLNPGPRAIATLVAPADREWIIRESWREDVR